MPWLESIGTSRESTSPVAVATGAAPVSSCPCRRGAFATRRSAFTSIRDTLARSNLDGLSFGGLFAWPKAIHEGNGEAQPIVDVRATDEQRDAILKIMSGDETEPGATIFNVFAATYSKVHTPMFKPIRIEADLVARTGPIRGRGRRRVAHRADQQSAHRLDHARQSLAPGRVRVGGGGAGEQPGAHDGRSPISLAWQGRHGHIALLNMTGPGVVRLAPPEDDARAPCGAGGAAGTRPIHAACRTAGAGSVRLGLSLVVANADAGHPVADCGRPTTPIVTFLMWLVMMIGMMVPSVAPTVLLFDRIARRGDPDGALFAPVPSSRGTCSSGGLFPSRRRRCRSCSSRPDGSMRWGWRRARGSRPRSWRSPASTSGCPQSALASSTASRRCSSWSRRTARVLRRAHDGCSPRTPLPRLLLGADAPAVRRWCDEPALGRCNRRGRVR